MGIGEPMVELNERGFFIFSAPDVVLWKKKLSESLFELGNIVLKNNDIPEVPANDLLELLDRSFAQDNIDSRSRIKLFVESFPCSIDMLSSINLPFIMNILDGLGFEHAYPVTVPSIRLDRPYVEQFRTALHQDSWYAPLNEKSVTIWSGLRFVSGEMGRLRIWPGSHTGGVLESVECPERQTRALADEKLLSKGIEVSLEDDQILVFDQNLVHESGENKSSQVRVSVQLRYYDLCTGSKGSGSFVCRSNGLL